MNKLSKEKNFDYENKELLGVMRIDFNDGIKTLCNTWNPRDLIKEEKNRAIKNNIASKRTSNASGSKQANVIEHFLRYVEEASGSSRDNFDIKSINKRK